MISLSLLTICCGSMMVGASVKAWVDALAYRHSQTRIRAATAYSRGRQL